MTITPELFVLIIVPSVGSLAWLFAIKGRVDAHDKQHADHESAIAAARADDLKRHEELRQDIAYIRQRIDSAINGKHA